MKSLFTRIKITAIVAYFKVYTSLISKESESLNENERCKASINKAKTTNYGVAAKRNH